ncbi:MAG: hypothetical protein JSW50_03380 [Candidatus Latescibacterota bacterium]|nr:MAG: hypothetical protein JSW50_03380 [Candidatus Latescibacterota bacterium]
MDTLTLTLILHLTVTSAMCGIIWFVQVVHYPLFRRVGEPGFTNYQTAHERRTSFVVIPLMVVEVITAVSLVVWMPAQPLVWLGLGMLVLIWISTFCLQVPQHRQLESGFDVRTHRRLVHTNWLRTILWSARVVLAAVLSSNAA